MSISMKVVFFGLALALAYITGKIMDRNSQNEIRGLGLTVVLPGDPGYDDARLACESIRFGATYSRPLNKFLSQPPL